MSALTITSFAYSQGPPPEANLILDMRFLRNPHWDADLGARDGRDPAVGAYVAADPAYAAAMAHVEALILALAGRYGPEGKPCFSVAFGCTGGRHRSVHVAERVAARLREAGFSPTLSHRDLAASAANIGTDGFQGE